MAEIQLRNLSKSWGNFVAVKNFNLTIADKEFLVLLGPSGCGKTTTMRMIAGLEDISEGEIFIDGKLVINEVIYNSFVWVTLGCFGISEAGKAFGNK